MTATAPQTHPDTAIENAIERIVYALALQAVQQEKPKEAKPHAAIGSQ
jgi:hypothetical protein